MSKTFSHAGVSRLHGKFKVRWANGAERVKVLIKGGHTDIDLIELMHPMTKEAAVAALLSMDFDNGNAEVRACLEAEAKKRKIEGYADVKSADADAAEEAVEEDNNVIEVDLTPAKELSMTPSAIRKREQRAAQRAAASAMTAWAEAADAEEAAAEDAVAA